MRRACFAAALLAACASEAPVAGDDAGATYIALSRDFEGFRAWSRHAVGSEALAGHAAGPRFVYRNRPIPPTGQAYPVGTILVKTVESDADPTHWELFAMVKRGGGFNAEGAAGWEYFRLQFSSPTALVITGRGLDPSDGESYLTGDAGAHDDASVGCNACHGASARGSDHVLSAALVPGAR